MKENNSATTIEVSLFEREGTTVSIKARSGECPACLYVRQEVESGLGNVSFVQSPGHLRRVEQMRYNIYFCCEVTPEEARKQKAQQPSPFTGDRRMLS